MRRYTDDTISAVATPVGNGGIGIIRISGKDAIGVGKKIFRPVCCKPEEFPQFRFRTQRAYYGRIFAGDECIDEGLLTLFRRPRSYTGEDVVEISFHGGHLMAGRILTVTFQHGCRQALPGEFTKRAFLNGRIDLTQAEAVADLISANSDQALRLAKRQLDGSLKALVTSLKNQVLHCLAQLNVVIDFPEEGISCESPKAIAGRLATITAQLQTIGSCLEDSVRVRHGFHVVILGLPNVGKSSLLNAIVGMDRAIVSSVPGTTRDTIDVVVQICGLPVRFVDTAGLRDSACGVEKLGIDRSNREACQADLILFVVDRSRKITQDELRKLRDLGADRVLVVLNKCDLNPKNDLNWLGGFDFVETSCVTGTGIELLRSKVGSFAARKTQASHSFDFILNHRQAESIYRARNFLIDCKRRLEEGNAIDFVADDLWLAADALGEIIGDTTTEQVLDKIFSSFCVGK